VNGKHRSSIAIAAAVLLTGAGVAAVANGITSPETASAAEPTTAAAPTPDPREVALEQSVTDLLAQATNLQASIAAIPEPAPAAPKTATRKSATTSGTAASPAAEPEPAPAAAPSATATQSSDDSSKGGEDD